MPKSARAVAQRPRAHPSPLAEVDLDAVLCADVGHHWRIMQVERGERRTSVSSAERQMICMTCGTLQVQAVAWDGHVVQRWYEYDETYITNARGLGDTPGERRARYRAEQLRRARQEWAA